MKSKFKQKSETTTWETQSGNFITSKKVSVDFCLTESSATKIVSWKCHVDNSTYSRYGMILGRDLLTALVLGLKLSKNIVVVREGTYEGFLAPLFDVSNYEYKPFPDK